ncbi:8629_t:CDS:2 [Entrophospora sp. SA101]|nr:5763_t:CDS:2 [Entrophospora sp. SA101]CAJ0903322.1 8629_t:CDS:2 [Entrophospora sp. SA101]
MIRQSIEKTSKTLKLQLKTLKSRLKSLNSLLKKINVEYISEKEKRFKHQLKRENILYDYNSFQNIELIDGGSFGTIYCASSKHHQELVALKSINIDHSFEQLLNEAKQHCRVEHHSNILGFYGITKEKHKKNYMFVLEYANNGNLCDYLKSNFNTMDWNIKLKFAKQIVSAHSKNILIHNGNIKICDFGISKSLLDSSIEASKRLGTIRYSDPQYLGNIESYSRNEKSDIYSIGVLLWEISSGHAPFADKSITSKCIIVAIILGERETIIKGTPKKYAEIYTACWQGKPDLRPHIHEVMRDLDNVDITNTIEDIVNLTDQTNNELQIDGLNNHLKEDKLQNDLLYSTELLLSA